MNKCQFPYKIIGLHRLVKKGYQPESSFFHEFQSDEESFWGYIAYTAEKKAVFVEAEEGEKVIGIEKIDDYFFLHLSDGYINCLHESEARVVWAEKRKNKCTEK